MNATNTSKSRHRRDAYGNCSILEPNFAPDPDGKSDYGNNYLFTGRRLDILNSGSLKIQYNRNRYYDYYTGRWLTHDPLGITPNCRRPNEFRPLGQYEDALNLYEMMVSNPMLETDPWGLYVSFRMCRAGIRVLRMVAYFRSKALALGVPPMLGTGHPYEHCVSACNLTRTWGRYNATTVLDMKEDLDEEVADYADTIHPCLWWLLRLTRPGHMATTYLSDWVCSAHQKSDEEDNYDGMDCGDNRKFKDLSCEECCKKEMNIWPKTEEGTVERKFGPRCQGRYKKAMEEKLGREVIVEDPK